MKTVRISASSYSNTAPLIWSFLYGRMHGKVELILDNAPARSADLLAEKRVSAALVPVIGFQMIDNVHLIPDVCVGARERVRSVCLVTRGKDLSEVKSVALDVSSKTSAALTKIIFREFLGFEPLYTMAQPDARTMLRDADCALLIGDPALVIADSEFKIADRDNSPRKGQSKIADGVIRKFDLVKLWREFTGFGFVFAMWMTKDRTCAIDFAAARTEGLLHLSEIIANFETALALARPDFTEYLAENISYSIDESMQQGLELYFELAKKNGLIAANRPLEYVKDHR